MWKTVLYSARILITYLILCLAVFLMLRTVSHYTDFRNDVEFLVFKQDYLNNSVWKVAFYIHVFSAVVALLAGFTQFSEVFLGKHRTLHRFFGYIYVWNILAINFPAALIMAIYANGGAFGKTAFILLDILWFGFTFLAVKKAIRGDFKAHRDYMIRSFALTLSAITLRTWKLILVKTGWIDPSQIYVVEAWIGFVPNLIVAELIIRFQNYRLNGIAPDASIAKAVPAKATK